MNQALLLVARWIGLAHERWREATTRRPLTVEIDVLRDLVARIRSAASESTAAGRAEGSHLGAEL